MANFAPSVCLRRRSAFFSWSFCFVVELKVWYYVCFRSFDEMSDAAESCPRAVCVDAFAGSRFNIRDH
jgi:hypothetical protein